MKNKNKVFKESTIGKIIHGFLLFMPLIAIGFTCLISTFNMSGKQESEIVYKYETNEVNNANDLIVGRIYHYTRDISNLNTDFVIGRFGAIFNLGNSNEAFITAENQTGFTIYKNSGLSVNISYYPVYSNVANIYALNNTIEFDCLFFGLHENDSFNYYSLSEFNVFDYVETNNLDTQDIFYKAIDKVEQSNLFNWSKNSIIYTGIHNTTEKLSISNTFIPMLLTYWLIISVVYILYDIILMMLVIFHRKVHSLQDSI